MWRWEVEKASDVPQAMWSITRNCWIQTPGSDPVSSQGSDNEFANMEMTSYCSFYFSSFLQKALYRNIKLNFLAFNPKVAYKSLS
jgi:hypothetical protein